MAENYGCCPQSDIGESTDCRRYFRRRDSPDRAVTTLDARQKWGHHADGNQYARHGCGTAGGAGGHLGDTASDNGETDPRRNGNSGRDCAPHGNGHAYFYGDSDGQPVANADADSHCDTDSHINPDSERDTDPDPDRYGGVCAGQRLSLRY